ncbi:HET-domain-containing protein [Pseudovirgaria hyperparasitica]|uniref:HET-domain-containing protein n=1 Tax=Pseudovirgaria hyperparasitica TaxID=470096 RepID=A0A6A6W3U6_9PEZI|nr:HET-domain-containing protein [Pseudovirgaria hyperparasitica]KAF2756829.1 HET-domain-containing protein [Pseudovirgaria hyperparasitica]
MASQDSVYRPLPKGVDAIRILTVKPEQFPAPLNCELRVAAFSERPKYAALSYTWGDSHSESFSAFRKLKVSIQGRHWNLAHRVEYVELGTITINGMDVPVQNNVNIALRHLRSATQPLSLWVDAVCINQGDVAEVNAQVAMMSFIYTRAVKVAAWIGFPTSDWQISAREWSSGQTRAFSDVIAGNAKRFMWSAEPDHNELTRIAESAYWTRLWIVQEMCLAADVVFVYGAKIWSFEHIKAWASMRSAQVLKEHSKSIIKVDQVNVFATMLDCITARNQRFSEDMQLEQLVERFSKCSCSEPRDRVYGLMGLANDTKSSAQPHTTRKTPSESTPDPDGWDDPGDMTIQIDYTRSFFDIWKDVIHHRLAQGPGGSRYYSNPKAERHMSLVRFAGVVQAALNGKVEEELRTGGTSISQDLIHAPLNIRVLGFVCSTIAHIDTSHSSLFGSFSAQQAWHGSWTRLQREMHRWDLVTLREKDRGYMSKICEYTDDDLGRIRDISSPRVLAWPWKEENPIDCGNDTRSSPAQGLDEEPRICLGTNNFIGLAPRSAKVGDVIVRFINCNAALVMRRLSARKRKKSESLPSTIGKSYTLIGRADVASKVNAELSAAPESPAQMMGKSTDLLYVDLNFHLLQLITAGISTKAEFKPREA